VWHVLAAPDTPGHALATTKVANDFPVGNLQVRPKGLCRLHLRGGKPKIAKLRASPADRLRRDGLDAVEARVVRDAVEWDLKRAAGVGQGRGRVDDRNVFAARGGKDVDQVCRLPVTFRPSISTCSFSPKSALDTRSRTLY
jgi:hypothetical protein